MLHYESNELCLEAYPIAKLAKKWGTPLFIYSKKKIEENWQAFSETDDKQSQLVCYAVKANSNLSLLRLFAKLGAGFDIVSRGELERVLLAGGAPNKIIFSGVGKSAEEIARALKVGIYCFNVESLSELKHIGRIAKKQNCVAPISLRVNPDIAIKSHPYITTGLKDNKFGISSKQFSECIDFISKEKALKLKGIACHIGSQITELQPFQAAMKFLLAMADKLSSQGHQLEFVDIGGGLGVAYRGKQGLTIKKYVSEIKKMMRTKPYRLVFEPGRSLIANAGMLVSKVEYIKKNGKKYFAIVDAAMTELMRPALYQAWHDIIPVIKKSGKKQQYDIVGPVCESADFLGTKRHLVVNEHDLLLIKDVGAYGFSLSSNYNSRLRAAEVLVSGSKAKLIRKREVLADLWDKELL